MRRSYRIVLEYTLDEAGNTPNCEMLPPSNWEFSKLLDISLPYEILTVVSTEEIPLIATHSNEMDTL